jgi:hypothetical protein
VAAVNQREKDLTLSAIHQAAGMGLLAHWCQDSRKCLGRGFPDLMFAGPGGIGFAEVKTSDGDTSAEQDLWLWTLAKHIRPPLHVSPLQFVRLWQPSDFWNGTVDNDLGSLA